MDQILKKYNKSVGDAAKMKKRVKKTQAAKKEASKPSSYVEDEDGWITVHYKGGRDPTKKHSNKSCKKKGKNKEGGEKLINFYAFEVKEAKLKKHKELLEKFEEDKRRLAKMREQRKFKI